MEDLEIVSSRRRGRGPYFFIRALSPWHFPQISGPCPGIWYCAPWMLCGVTIGADGDVGIVLLHQSGAWMLFGRC